MKIVEKYKIFIAISAAIILAGLIAGILFGGFNAGIDFSGGSIVTVDMAGDFDDNVVEKALSDTGINGATVQKSGVDGAQTYAEIRMKPMGNDEEELTVRENLLKEVQKTYPDAQLKGVDRVGAVASKQLILSAVYSILIAGVLILIYIGIRFEFHSAIAAIICLLHDVLIMLSVVCIIRLEVNSSFIAAVLTIVGYSINNTIVVFDRVRDNRKSNPKMPMRELVNTSIKETLTRSIYTSLTTLVTIGMLYLLGVSSIRQFALPIIVGLLAGTYSSLFMAGPIWVLLSGRMKEPASKEKQKKAKKASA